VISVLISITISKVIHKMNFDNEDAEEIRRLRSERHHFHQRKWLRHNAMVPKGFIRYHVLQALSEQPMSGSELMDKIEKQTGGNWKPSPGSIYPLLSFLQDNAYIKELPTENGLKRYEITQAGKDLLEEQIKIRDKFAQEGGIFASPFFDRFFCNAPKEKTDQIRFSMKRLMVASMNVAKSLKESYSEKCLDEALKALDEASGKLENINIKLKGEKS
jgi:DNA-binding PadR family transcriptional regulator